MANQQKKTEAGVRPPVVVVLGHVDHGKSSLLEAIRDFRITARESGGITQHIGAYEVEQPGEDGAVRKITFIDTPGHEAFSAMRLRGAEVADIALLVVDASQGIQPQTKEAVAAVKKAQIPMIVVFSKADLPAADSGRVARELAGIGVLTESMGGEIPSVEVSAKEKTGINELLEMILLVAELQYLRSDTAANAEGLVIESYMDKLKGSMATVIVEKGILRLKDVIATDSAAGKVRGLRDFLGKTIDEAMPSQPAVILGFEALPGVGERFKRYESGEAAQAKTRSETKKRRASAAVLDMEPGQKVFSIILKADVFGSLEAIEGMLKNLPQEKVVLRVLKSEIGDINESDAKLAELSQAQIIGFRVKVDPGVVKLIRADGQKRLRIKAFDVIYELVQGVRAGMEKSLEQETVRREVGAMKALVLFWAEKNRQIVGGKITSGEIRKGAKLEVLRNGEKVGQGKIINLQRNRKDADRLKKGDECGILFEGNTKVEEGDVLVGYEEERTKAML